MICRRRPSHMVFSEKNLRHKNYILRLLTYINARLFNCTSYCVVCDRAHEHESVRFFPCADNPLCQTTYEDYGRGNSLAYEVIHNPDTVDLLTCMCMSACRAPPQRRELLLDPFPVDYVEVTGKGNARQTKKNWDALVCCFLP